ncbi:MAG: membrane protein insertase YidC [Candidatus Krumholzibacteriia bacterium]
MDKRTLAAFLLIFLILVGWSAMMERMAGDRPATTEPDTTVAAERRIEPDLRLREETGEAGMAPGGEMAERLARQERTGQEPTGQERPQDERLWDDRPREDARDRAAADWQDERTASPVTATEALQPATAAGTPQTVTVRTPLYTAEISGQGARITSLRLANYDMDDGTPVDLIPDTAPANGADLLVFEQEILPLGDRVFESVGESTVHVDSGRRSVVFRARTRGGLEIRKTYWFEPGSYGVGLDLVVAAVDPERAQQTLTLTGRPERVVFGWNQGIAVTERPHQDAVRQMSFARSFARVGEDLHFKKRDALSKSPEKVEEIYTGAIRFAGVQNKYFTVIGIVPPTAEGMVSEGRAGLSGDQQRMQQTWALDLPLRTVRGGSELASRGIEIYIGPQKDELLSAYQVGLEDTMDMGWSVFRPLARGVVWIMEQMARVIPNYGVIIILFSVLTKLAFYPLTRKSTESMKRMQELQPKIKELQAKYKDNREKLSQATMELYKKEKINPMAGCLPLLIQMPVFVALYQGLMHTIALRHKEFALWIDDLSQPDALFALPFSIPFLGSEFNVLPILMAAAMWVQTKLTPTGAAGGQMALMNSVLPVMMLFFFYQMPSGLVIYWLVNTLMQIYQSWRIHKTAPQGSVTTA